MARSQSKSSSGLIAGGLLFLILVAIAILVLSQGPPPSKATDSKPNDPVEAVDPFADLPPERPDLGR